MPSGLVVQSLRRRRRERAKRDALANRDDKYAFTCQSAILNFYIATVSAILNFYIATVSAILTFYIATVSAILNFYIATVSAILNFYIATERFLTYT